jgi:ABC-2 type transport system permease protein
MNFFCAIFEIAILYVILKPSIYWQTNNILLLYTMLAVFLATLLFFLFGLLLGAVGFWSAEVWGPRFIFGIAIAILSGQMFPMDMLPKPLFIATQFLPFTYLIYFPVKIYLGQLPFSQILFGLSVATFWVGCLYFIVRFVWQKGLLQYSAQGR